MKRYDSVSTPENATINPGDLIDILADNVVTTAVICEVLWVNGRKLLCLDIDGFEWFAYYNKKYNCWYAYSS